MKRLLKRITRYGLSGAIGAVLTTVLGILCLDPGLLFLPQNLADTVMRRSYDLMFPARGTVPLQDDGVVVVYLDDASHEELNQSYLKPWKRDYFVKLLEVLKAEKAKAVVFDVVFSDPDDNPTNDLRFAEALKSFTNYVIAADWTTPKPGKKERTVAPPHELFFDSLEQIGLSEMQPDDDFVPREAFVGSEEDQVYSLSWATARMTGLPVTKEPGAVRAKRWINYYGPAGHVPFVSFHRAISDGNDRPPPGFFTGKVVFVGSRIVTFMAGTRKDEYSSPFSYWSGVSKFMPGVEIHATQYLNLLRRDWLTRLTKASEGPLVVLLGIVIGISFAHMRPLGATLIALISAVAVFLTAYFFFSRIQIWFPWYILVGVQIPVAWAWSLVYNSVTLYVDKRLMQQSLSMYVSPKRVTQIAKEQEMLKPGAQKQELSILFSDIANFTSMSEGMDSDELATLMNDYFEKAVTNCIHVTDGTVVKYIGDAIFAIWNAPELQANHPELACKGALKLRDEASTFESIKTRKPELANLDIRTRIGLHFGVANVGNFGSKSRVDYTALGENINLASRMEGLNKYLGTDILITGDVEERVKGKFITRYAGRFQLKGFERAVEVHELLDLPENAARTAEWRAVFEEGRACFARRDFEGASKLLHKVIDIRGGKDGPSKFLLKQIDDFVKDPPGPDWQGEIELKEK